jgi:hypothetical protein
MDSPVLPEPRGAASAALLAALHGAVGALDAPPPDGHEDLHLALYC